MEESKKYRWTLAGLIVMVVLNIGLIASIWIIQPPPNPFDRPSFGLENRGLSLTPSQRSELDRLLRERLNVMRAIGSDIDFKIRGYFSLIADNDTVLTQEELDSLVVHIQRRQAEFDSTVLEYEARMRQILNEEQQPQFDELMARDDSAIARSRQMRREELRRMFRRPLPERAQ